MEGRGKGWGGWGEEEEEEEGEWERRGGEGEGRIGRGGEQPRDQRKGGQKGIPTPGADVSNILHFRIRGTFTKNSHPRWQNCKGKNQMRCIKKIAFIYSIDKKKINHKNEKKKSLKNINKLYVNLWHPHFADVKIQNPKMWKFR